MLDRDNFIKALFPELGRSYRFGSWTSCNAAVQGWSMAIDVFRLIVVYKEKLAKSCCCSKENKYHACEDFHCRLKVVHQLNAVFVVERER